MQHKKYSKGRWRIFTPRHKPDDNLRGHLTFALKYEGIDLAVLKVLFGRANRETIADIIRSEPTGAYNRRIWFLYLKFRSSLYEPAQELGRFLRERRRQGCRRRAYMDVFTAILAKNAPLPGLSA